MNDRHNSSSPTQTTTLDGTSWKVLILVVLLAVIFWLFMTRSAPQLASSHPAVGSPAPTLNLVQLIPVSEVPAPQQQTTAELATGTAAPARLVGLPEAGKVTLLHIWGTWCPPCRLEYPELIEMTSELASEPRFQFITISCGGGGPDPYEPLQSATLAYYHEIDAGELLTYADLEGLTRRSLMEQLDESVVYPTTVLISPEQRIAGVWLGYSPAGVSEMRQAITDLLEHYP